MSLPAPHELERLRRRLTELVQAEQYLDALEVDLDEVGDRPIRPANYTVVDEVRVPVPPNPDRDLELMLDVFDHALERSSKCPSP